MIENLELRIDQLLLDQGNPRLGATSSQSEALASIDRLNLRHFQNLTARTTTCGSGQHSARFCMRRFSRPEPCFMAQQSVAATSTTSAP